MVNLLKTGICFAFAGIMLAGVVSASRAQSVGLPAPRLLTTMPMGGKAGTTVEVVITGEHIDDAGELVFSHPGLAAKPKVDAAGKPVPNAYMVTIATDCPPGLHEARVLTRLGASSARVFSVGSLTEVTADKPNKTLATAREVPVNSVFNGVISDRQVDFISFQAAKGQRLIVDCATRGIDSKLNATVIIADAAGRDLMVERRGGALDFTAPADGRYVVKVHELTFKGGPAYFYRLGLWEQPKGTPVARQPSTRQVNGFSWPPQGLAARAPTVEAEPNNDPAKAQKIKLPCDILGRFYPAADVDYYEFDAKKGEEWWIEVASERLGLPTDPSILVQKVTPGATETAADVLELADIPSPVKVSSNGYAYDGPPYNAGTSDILGKLAVKEDGLYRLRIADLFGGTRSEPNHEYRLVIRRAEPDFALVSWALHMELRNGDRNALSKPIALRGGASMAFEVVAFRRDGFDGEIELTMEGLPKGVTARGLKIPAGQSRGMMIITAAEDAPRGYGNAVFSGKAIVAGKPVTRPCRLASMAWPIPDAWGEIPSPRLLMDVPVSVSGQEKAPLVMAPKAPVIEAKAGEKVTVPLAIRKTSEFSGDKIKLKAAGAGFEKAPGFDVSLKANEAQAVLDLAALKVPPGEYTVSFLGGAVVKYRHRPEMVAVAEAASKKMQLEVQSLEAEVKKVAGEAQSAPPAKKDQVAKAMAAATAKMKAATDALNASKDQLKRASDAAQPRDIADIVVSEPVIIRVKPGDKK